MTWNRPERDERALGDWTIERRDDELADLRWRGHRVLRSIRAVVRDGDWKTLPLTVGEITGDAESLEISVRTIESAFEGSIRATTDGAELAITLDLRATRDVDTNRTGLIVLHPPQVTGAALRVGHPDGTTEPTAFPERISAHQPVFDITSLAWTHDGAAIDLAFDGDVFEMEDQRNWTDASFKTYNRPLSLPFPYRVAAGEHVVQALRIRVQETTDAATPALDDRIRLTPAGPFPTVGVAAASAPDPAPRVDTIGETLLVELDLASRDWRAALARAAASGLALDVRFVLDPAAPEKISDAVAALAGTEIVRATAFHQVSDARHVSDGEAIDLLRTALAAHGRTPEVIGGSRSHFTELNRELHRLPDDLDGIAVTVTPLFHSADTEQIVESVAMQRLVAEESVARAAGHPVHIGPVSLRPRFNDVAASPQPLSPHDDLRDGYGPQFTGTDDDRQRAPELAAWTAASAAALAVPGVASLVWFEEWGPRGIRSSDGEDFPVAGALHALAALAASDGATLLTGPSPDGLTWAIGARTVATDDILAVNIADEPRALRIETDHGEASVSLEPSTFIRISLPRTEEPLA
jgi:D-apionolactonase